MMGIPNKHDKQEYILCAAIHFDDGAVYEHQPVNILSGVVIMGGRHSNAFATLAALGISREDYEFPPHQGFITSKNRFLNRAESAKIAFAAGQTDENMKYLVSEDLY